MRCDIKSFSFIPPKRPANCQLEWGDAFPAHPGPAGPRRLPRRHGPAGARIGKITCTSRTAGLTCRNPDAHGFFLSRERIRLF